MGASELDRSRAVRFRGDGRAQLDPALEAARAEREVGLTSARGLETTVGDRSSRGRPMQGDSELRAILVTPCDNMWSD